MSETIAMFAFGAFDLDTDRRQLRCRGAQVALSSRAFDILVMLIECRGRVVTKDEIILRVWRGMIVEENNLAVQISALRRALADGTDGASVIMTVPGQGYRFVGRLGRGEPEHTAFAVAPPAFNEVVEPLPVSPALADPPAQRGLLSRRLPLFTAVLAIGVLGLAGFEILRPVHAPAPEARVAAPPRLSIAVLPFRDLSDDRCCDYLADAISDDLTTDLSLIPGSVVIARESSDVYRGHPAPAAEIGRALGVRYLLEGSLRAMDGAFSINAQLIEAPGGTHLWAERFTVPRTHLGDAQTAIVQRLSSALGVKLVDIEGARSVREHPADPDALDLFLRARSILDRSDSLEGMNQAQALLEKALAKQPDNVQAGSELGWLLVRKIHNYVTPHRERDLAEAQSVVAHAAHLAPRDAEVLAARAALQTLDNDCSGAQRTYRLALDGNPHSVNALTGLIVCKFRLGQFAEAAASLAALLTIDPEGSREKTRLYQIGFADLMMGKAAEAVPWLERSLAIDSDAPSANDDLGLVEWTRAALVAATRLSGDTVASSKLLAAYQQVWPYRSTWALESRSPRTFSTIGGFRSFLSALEAEGMPRFVDEDAGRLEGGCTTAGFTPTPHSVSGIRTIGTTELVALMASGKPRIVDFGPGAAVPPQAVVSTLDPTSAPEMSTLRMQLQASKGGAVVIMAGGPLDFRGCQVALTLSGKGMDALWYRGGEEAWAKAGLSARDLR